MDLLAEAGIVDVGPRLISIVAHGRDVAFEVVASKESNSNEGLRMLGRAARGR